MFLQHHLKVPIVNPFSTLFIYFLILATTPLVINEWVALGSNKTYIFKLVIYNIHVTPTDDALMSLYVIYVLNFPRLSLAPDCVDFIGLFTVMDDTTKRLMSSSKCRSVEVINNRARPRSNHMEVDCVNYRQQQQQEQ